MLNAFSKIYFALKNDTPQGNNANKCFCIIHLHMHACIHAYMHILRCMHATNVPMHRWMHSSMHSYAQIKNYVQN